MEGDRSAVKEGVTGLTVERLCSCPGSWVKDATNWNHLKTCLDQRRVITMVRHDETGEPSGVDHGQVWDVDPTPSNNPCVGTKGLQATW